MSIILNGTTGITTPDVTADSGESLTSRVAKTGDTMTGVLTIQNAGFDSRITLQNTGTGGQTFNVFSTMDSFTQGGGNLLFHTSSAPNGILKMDSAGRVTMPYQPHARVSRNTGAIPGGSVIVFNYADENTAGVYNASNGRFTAPVAGRYLFAHGMFSQNGYNAYLAWRVNGTVIATTYDNNSNYDSVAGSIVLSMSAGDYADLFVVAGASYQIYGSTAVQCWATFTLLS